MSSKINKIFNEKVKKKQSKVDLLFLNRFLKFLIPFNSSHDLKVTQLGEGKAKILLPYKRKNFNHLRGIHAAALITAGEYAAGLSLANCLGLDKYRFIMQKLEGDYVYQARKNVHALCEFNDTNKLEVLEDLKHNDKTMVELKTYLNDEDGNEVATVTSLWQIKDWKSVKLK